MVYSVLSWCYYHRKGGVSVQCLRWIGRNHFLLVPSLEGSIQESELLCQSWFSLLCYHVWNGYNLKIYYKVYFLRRKKINAFYTKNNRLKLPPNECNFKDLLGQCYSCQSGTCFYTFYIFLSVFLIADDIKPCPRCAAYIIKMNDGSCNHMTCAVCGCEFCWLCMKEISDLHYLR